MGEGESVYTARAFQAENAVQTIRPKLILINFTQRDGEDSTYFST